MFRRCSLRFSIAAEGLHILELRQQLRQLYVKGEANVNTVYLFNDKYKSILALSIAGRGQDICEAVSAKTVGKYLRYIVPTVFRDSAKKVLPR